MEELVDIFDENAGKKTGKIISKKEAHKKGIWHSAVHLFIINKDKTKTLLQKRCKDKDLFDKRAAIKKLKKLGERSYYKYKKEYPYRDVPHRYIAEKYMEDESGYELKDYKFFCFDGKPKILFVATGRQNGDIRFDFYDTEFHHLPIINGHPNADVWPTKPDGFNEMLEVAERLSQGMPHVRVDLYNCNGKIYFGELTFFHWSGMVPFEPVEWDYKFGEYLRLPKKHDLQI